MFGVRGRGVSLPGWGAGSKCALWTALPDFLLEAGNAYVSECITKASGEPQLQGFFQYEIRKLVWKLIIKNRALLQLNDITS